jgi:hypothetical protein
VARRSDADLLTLDDDALVAELAAALAAEARAAGASIPDPGTLLDDARRLIARWDTELFGACCTDDPAYEDLRGEIGDIARVADALLVDALTGALATASNLPRSVARLIAAFAVKHGFEVGRGLACDVWARVVAPVSP